MLVFLLLFVTMLSLLPSGGVVFVVVGHLILCRPYVSIGFCFFGGEEGVCDVLLLFDCCCWCWHCCVLFFVGDGLLFVSAFACALLFSCVCVCVLVVVVCLVFDCLFLFNCVCLFFMFVRWGLFVVFVVVVWHVFLCFCSLFPLFFVLFVFFNTFFFCLGVCHVIPFVLLLLCLLLFLLLCVVVALVVVFVVVVFLLVCDDLLFVSLYVFVFACACSFLSVVFFWCVCCC